jgi:uncharacterized membrane protein YciS (DUF1049 family)
MTNDRVEMMLETLTRAQNRMVSYLALGFISGFAIGVLAAWLMYSISR